MSSNSSLSSTRKWLPDGLGSMPLRSMLKRRICA